MPWRERMASDKIRPMKHTPYSYRDDPAVPKFDDMHPIAFIDGECALCSTSARMLHRLDRTGNIRICPVQTETGRAVLAHYGLRADAPESWLWLADGCAHMDAEGIIAMARRLGGWARVVGLMRVLPKPLRSWLYRRVARNRYAVFGRGDLCALPEPGLRARLME